MASSLLQPNQLVELSTFDAAFSVTPEEEDQVRRRYMTLLVDEQRAPRRGASSTVYRVTNTECMPFALKILKSDDLEPQERERILPVRAKTFTEEYRAQAAVSGIAGFPRLYGIGTIGDEPAILMEWVEGFTLNEVTPQLSADIYGRIDARCIAGIGIAVLQILKRAREADTVFVHRDLSPRNIMLRANPTPLDEQIRSNTYDICLIDLGSATVKPSDSSLTMLTNIWRNGTPDYAPPEMLTTDAPDVIGLRSSSAIDVYALCSILYELYAQTPPFGRGLSVAASPYRVKADNDPMPLVPRSDGDLPLVGAIMAGLPRGQSERIGAGELLDRLESWLDAHDSEQNDAARANCPHAGALQPVPVPAANRDASAAAPSPTAPTDATGRAAPATRPISRRRLLIGAGCGIAAVALGTAAVATGGFGLLHPKSIDDYTWDELAAISAEISAAESDEDGIATAQSYGLLDADGHIDDTRLKRFMFNGIPHRAQLVGIRHDELADGSGVAGMTFMFNEIAAEKPMIDSASSEEAWEDSDMRSWLNGTFYNQLDKDLSAVVKPVLKYTNNIGGTEDPGCVTPTEDRIWLFSYCELAGARERLTFSEGYRYLADILNGEGAQYAYFRERGVMPLSTHPSLVRNREDEADFWWLRSASPDVSLAEGVTNFNRVGPNGDPFHFATVCTDNSGVLPGFCI